MEKQNIQKTLMTHHFETSVRMLGPESVQINCQHCRSYVRTLTESNIKQRYLVGWCICCIGLWIPCFWCCLPCLPCMAAIPCCKKEFKVITHTCPNCEKVIGKYNGFDLAQHFNFKMNKYLNKSLSIYSCLYFFIHILISFS